MPQQVLPRGHTPLPPGWQPTQRAHARLTHARRRRTRTDAARARRTHLLDVCATDRVSHGLDLHGSTRPIVPSSTHTRAARTYSQTPFLRARVHADTRTHNQTNTPWHAREGTHARTRARASACTHNQTRRPSHRRTWTHNQPGRDTDAFTHTCTHTCTHTRARVRSARGPRHLRAPSAARSRPHRPRDPPAPPTRARVRG
jgi:hypothetical protein